jgi:uncharacterized membrane protein YqjE
MADRPSGAAASRDPGHLHWLKTALAILSSSLHTRLELFVTELEEERERLKQTLVLILLGLFGLTFGFILFTIFLVALFWDRGWISAIGGLSAIYLVVGFGAIIKLRNAFLSRPGLFPATLAELGKDRDELGDSSGE